MGGFSDAPYLQQRIRDGIRAADCMLLGKAPEVVAVRAPYAAVLQGEGLQHRGAEHSVGASNERTLPGRGHMALPLGPCAHVSIMAVDCLLDA